MKKNLHVSVLFVYALLFGFSVNAQNHADDRGKPCQQYLEDKNVSLERLANRAELKTFTEEFIADKKKRKAPVQEEYVIPVVYHIVLPSGTNAQVTEAQVQNSINIVNENFHSLHSDWNDTDSRFDGVKSTLKVTLCLAKKDPDGNSTNGIDRIYASKCGRQPHSYFAGISWDNKKYMNIYIVQDVECNGGATNSGYAYYPGDVPVGAERVVFNHKYLGYLGSSTATPTNWNSHMPRVMTHEVGHWLNLKHTFNGGCNVGDDVADTPPIYGSGSGGFGSYGNNCNKNLNECGGLVNVENFMDYDNCARMFTKGQCDRMDAALNSTKGGRSYLWKEDNLIATGCMTVSGPRLSYNGKINETAAANDGSTETKVTVEISEGEFAKSSGTYSVGSDYVVSNVPAGLTIVVTAISSTELEISATGNANNHALSNNISNLTIEFKDGAFKNLTAAQVNNFKKSNLKVCFNDPYEVICENLETFTLTSSNTWKHYAGLLDGEDFGLWYMKSGDTDNPEGIDLMRLETYAHKAVVKPGTTKLKFFAAGDLIGPGENFQVMAGFPDQFNIYSSNHQDFKGKKGYAAISFLYKGNYVNGWIEIEVNASGTTAKATRLGYSTQPNGTIAAGACDLDVPVVCKVSGITKGTQTSCDPTDNSYKQKVTVSYSDAPATGQLDVNDQTFAITSSPQEVELVGLVSDGQGVAVTAKFTADATCTKTVQNLFTAPVNCIPVCEITAISAGTQGACEPTDNTYKQKVTITYAVAPSSGQLDVNGQTFAITSSPQEVELIGLVSDGQSMDVTAKFTAETSCTFMKSGLFTAPVNCTPVCEITAIAKGVQTACDPKTITYSQEVIVTYETEPSTGMLDVNGTQVAITGSPQTVNLTGLVADGGSINVIASFTTETSCTKSVNNLFTAPADCTPVCAITAVSSGTQGACDIATNLYTQDIEITYEDAPETGKLVVNGQEFDITTSPQLVTLIGLNSNGNAVDVLASFSAQSSCSISTNAAFTAPVSCSNVAVCEINAITVGDQGGCDPTTNAYTQKITIEFADQPVTGKLVVNGQEFDITTSPQEIELVDLTADGSDVNVTASFSDSPGCSMSKSALFSAPESCEPVCTITAIVSGAQTECDPASVTYTQEVTVTYETEPATGKLVVNGQEFDITGSPQMITLVDLTADGASVNITASFSDDTGCKLIETGLFTAAEACEPECQISDLTAGTTSECSVSTNTYTQEIIVTYTASPNSGALIVNGQNFPIEGSPQTITLVGLSADGVAVDVTAKFSTNENCMLESTGLYTAPEACQSTDVPVVLFVSNTQDVVPGGCVVFTDSTVSGTPIVKWNWNFEGGNPSTYSGQNPPSISYANAGTYKVTLKVTNFAGEGISEEIGYINVGTISAAPYCDAQRTLDCECKEEYITEVTIEGISNTTQCGNYNSFIDQKTDLYTWKKYTLSVKIGNLGISDVVLGGMFDWDQDKTFDHNEIYEFRDTDRDGIATVDITVPKDASLGETRLRVRLQAFGPIKSCGPSSFGEIEDYTVNVVSNPVAVEELDLSSGMSVYPNPSSGLFNLALDHFEKGNVNISVIDIRGRQVYTSFAYKHDDQLQQEIDLSNLEAGIYNIRVTVNGITGSKRIVKE